jgi:hypothetical protein
MTMKMKTAVTVMQMNAARTLEMQVKYIMRLPFLSQPTYMFVYVCNMCVCRRK